MLALLLLAAQAQSADAYDVVITNARLIDGTGRAARAADIGVRGGWIAKVGAAGSLRSALAKDRLDAKGLVVAPGFIDVHSHTDEAIADSARRYNEGAVRQGITTVVGGPDGGAAPSDMKSLIAALGRQGAGTNLALYVGHNGVRAEVMKDAQRAPTPEELARMKALVREGMELGAVGFSTGLMYEPGMWSNTDEVIELAKEVAPFRGIYDSHVRDPVKRFLWSDEEVIKVGEGAGIAPKIGHEKAVGLENAGKIREVIQLVNAARARGVNAVTDQYPYDGAATAPLRGIIVIPREMLKSGFDVTQALKDPASRAQLKQASENGINGGFAWIKATGYSSMRITTSRERPALVGKYLSELAAERKQDPFDLVSDLLTTGTDTIGITLGAIKEADVRLLLVQPWNMIASDGGYADSKSRPQGHPRSTGTFPRVLGHYVRDAKVLRLEEAVRKMTSLPADFVGLRDRGRVQEGLAADLAIFDPTTVADKSTWEQPQLMAVGVPHVLVNGVFVLRDGKLTGRTPGRYLRAMH